MYVSNKDIIRQDIENMCTNDLHADTKPKTTALLEERSSLSIESVATKNENAMMGQNVKYIKSFGSHPFILYSLLLCAWKKVAPSIFWKTLFIDTNIMCL
jgi:hypothetical protein